MKIAKCLFTVGMSIKVQKGIIDCEAYLIDKGEETFAVSGWNFHTIMHGAVLVRCVSLLYLIAWHYFAWGIGMGSIVTA